MLELAARPAGVIWGPGRYRLLVVETAFADAADPLPASWAPRMVAEMDAYFREASGGAVRWRLGGIRRVKLSRSSGAFHLTRRALSDRTRFWRHLTGRLGDVAADAVLAVIPEAAAVRGCFAVGPRWNSPRLNAAVQGLAPTVVRGAVVRPSTAWGTVAHELGHVLGLPDLYDYRMGRKNAAFTASRFVGPWDLMGRVPDDTGGARPHPMAWTRALAGWITLTDWNVAQPRCVIGPDGAAAIRVPAGDGLWLIVEARLQTGFDAVLPSSGVLLSVADEHRPEGRGPLRLIAPRRERGDGMLPQKPKWNAALQPGEERRQFGYVVRVLERRAAGYDVEIIRP